MVVECSMDGYPLFHKGGRFSKFHGRFGRFSLYSTESRTSYLSPATSTLQRPPPLLQQPKKMSHTKSHYLSTMDWLLFDFFTGGLFVCTKNNKANKLRRGMREGIYLLPPTFIPPLLRSEF